MRWTPAVLVLGLAACGPEGEVPDGVWEVTVTGEATDCTQDEKQGYQETFRYELYFDASNVRMEIDGEPFATGTRAGCNLSYLSSEWLEERSGGEIRWRIEGEAVYEGEAGGCDLPDDLDWQGTEVITVTSSTVEDVPEGCTYEMSTEGVYLGAG